jgi:hypothetical protein
VDDVVEFPWREHEICRIAGQPVEFLASGQAGEFVVELGRIAAEQRGVDASTEGIVGSNDAFEQPFAVEAGGTGDEKPRTLQLRPEVCRVRKNVFQVARGQRGCAAQNPTPRNPLILSAA